MATKTKTPKRDSRKNVHEGLKSLKLGAQTLNACLKAVNYALQEADYATELRSTSLKDVTLSDLLGLMGIDITEDLTVSKVRTFWTKNLVPTGTREDGSVIKQLGIYKNQAIYTKATERVYVIDEKKSEYVPLSIYRLQVVGNSDWTVANFVKGVEQNYLPLREEKRAAKSEETAQSYNRYFIKMEGAFIEISKDEIDF